MAENRNERAARLLRERRLHILRVDEGGLVVGECKGDSGTVWKLGWDPNKREWRCQCPASAKFKRTCAHLVSLQSVVTRP